VFLSRLDDGRFEVVTPIDASPAAQAGVQAGDIVERVDGREVRGLSLTELTGLIRGPAGSRVTLTLLRGGSDRVELSMPRAEYIVPTVKGFDRTADNNWNYFISRDPNVGYCRITQFTDDTLKSFQAALQQMLDGGMNGLVIDLRNNPGGRLEAAIAIADLFLEEGAIVTTKGRNRPESVARASAEDGVLPRFPVVVLLDETSASASEVLAGALADHGRATVVGMRSFGKGSVQEIVRLAGGGGELKITTAYYYLPSGRLVHRRKDAQDWGVDPHLRIPVEESAKAAVREARQRSENFRRPSSGTVPTPEPVDRQLEEAVVTLRALLLMSGGAPGTTRP
jgi:carboxyl-terminal processing protease